MHIRKKCNDQWQLKPRGTNHGLANARVSKSFCQTHGVHKISMSKILLIVIIYKKN